MPCVSDISKPRPEVESGQLHGIVSLYTLLDESEDVFESDAGRVLRATYPSDALRRLLARLATTLSESDADRKGNFIISGGYGSGKSHLLLVLYHLLNNRKAGAEWLAEHGVDFTPPEQAVAVLMPRNQLTMPGKDGVDYLWEPIFHGLGYDGFKHTGSNFPTAKHLKEAAAGRRVFLVIDEIERWFMPIDDPHQAEASVTFLQNLIEFSKDPDNGMITFITLLMLEPRICNVIQRDEVFAEDLTQAPDRERVVHHRLVDSVDLDAAAEVIEPYLDAYRAVDSHVRIGNYDDYRQRMLTCYPFHPETIDVVFQRYSSVARREDTSYQNSRGALYLLAHALQQTIPSDDPGRGQLSDLDLIRPGDISLIVDRLCDDLRNLNPALLDRACGNVHTSAATEHSAPVLSTIFLHSLGEPEEERQLGAEFGEILLGAVAPEGAPHGAATASEIHACLQKLDDTALNLHIEDDPTRWLFKMKINLIAQVNRRARSLSSEAASGVLVDKIREEVGADDRVAVFPEDEVPDRRDIVLVVSTKRLDSEEIIDKLYRGRSNPNGLVIVDPREAGSLTDDPDLVRMAQRILAAKDIQKDIVGDLEAGKQLQQIIVTQTGQLQQRIRDRYGAWLTPIVDAETGHLTFRRSEVRLDRTAILSRVEERYDDHHYERAVMGCVRDTKPPPTVADIVAEFYRQHSFPKPVYGSRPSDERIHQAIRELTRRAELEVVRGGDAHYTCGEDPGILQTSWTVILPEHPPPPPELPNTVLAFVRRLGDKGAAVQAVRAHCETETGEQGARIEAAEVDECVKTLVKEQKLELVGLPSVPEAPLPDDQLVRLWEAPPPERVAIGPVSIAQAVTSVIQELKPTDRVCNVEITVKQGASGKAVSDEYRELLGLADLALGGDVEVSGTWQIRKAPVTDRDGIRALLKALHTMGDARVEIQCDKEAAHDTEANSEGGAYEG